MIMWSLIRLSSMGLLAMDFAKSVIGRFGGVSCGAWGGAKVISRNYVCEPLCRFCVELQLVIWYTTYFTNIGHPSIEVT